nr:zinc finger, CCHC-type [Tanacetum cinerariifolium]
MAKKMHFMLSNMSLVYMLTTPMPEDGGENPIVNKSEKGLSGTMTIHYRGLILNDFKHTLKNLKEELTLIELGSYMCIEESLRVQDSDKPKGNNVVGLLVVNIVEHNNSFRYNDNKGKHKHHDTRANPNKKLKVTCWKCGKPRHLKKDCKAGNVGNRANGSSTKVLEDGSSNPLKGNESTALVHGRGCVDLRLNIVSDNIGLTFMSTLKLNDSIIWHARLGHVHFKRMNDMSKDGLILAIDMDTQKSLDTFKVFKTKVELQQDSLTKRFRTDREGEYMDTLYFQSVGIIHETTAPYNPQQNGISERKKRVIKEMVNSMLSYSGLSQGFWGEAMLTACYLLNRVPNKRNMITPYELWTKNKSNLNYLRVWGCREAVRLPDPKLKTLGERGIECIFVGYAEHSKAFKFYVIKPNDSLAINSIIKSRYAIFDEQRVTDEIVQQSELRKSKRHRTPKDFGLEFQLYLIERTRDEKEAINDVMDSIMKNNTWVMTDLPPGCKLLGCKWIFKRKLKVDGTIKKFKARLVIQSFKQKSRIYYFDIYALVARISSIRLMIDMAFIYNLIIHQVDVKTAFLNGELEEEVYMNQRLGFIMPGNDNKVCKLFKSLYGLKQTPKQWHQKFDEVVLSNGYLLNQADKCVYSKFDACGGSDQGIFVIKVLHEEHGEADVILGIRIKHESNGIAISQSRYIEKVLKKFNYSDCTPVSTPLDTCEKLMPNRGLAVSQHEYSRMIGCLMYAMTCTRPDIAFAVGNLSRLVYIGYPSVLEGYTDASWISNTKDNSSTSGWVFMLSGGAISWASKKQTCITGSIMEYELVALAATVSGGAEAALPPKITKQKITRRNELKAKSNMLLAISDEHLLKFHGIKDAKTLWEAIKTMFGGNTESKKMQKTILKKQYENFVASRSEGLDKTYDSLPPAWNTHTLIMRNKSDLDMFSMDDLYNNLKVYEAKIKGQSNSSSNSQSVAFVSLDNTSCTNEVVNTTHDVSALDNKDLEQIDTDDLEEMDLEWQLAMLTIRYDQQREILNKANLEIIAYQLGLESLEARIVVHQKNEAVFEEDIAFLKYDVKESDSDNDCEIRPSIEQSKPSHARINFVKSNENTRKSVIKQHTYKQAKNLRKSQNSRSDKRNWNGMMTQKLEDGTEFKKKACFVCGSLYHLIKNYNFYENKMVEKSVLNNKGKATGQREKKFCSNNSNNKLRHMMGNKSFLTYYQEIDGGFVAFRGSPKGGKISGKGGLTCLFAKATIDESNLWHRRLGYTNFKTINKLVKGNLVRGLPSKILKNDHTCVACQNGKQHKTSCKTKLASSISQPIQMLHMYLFSPTSVKSLNNKMYCLVVTDFSRFSWVFFLASKDETSGILKSFIICIENQLNHRVKIIRCDNGTEFKNSEMNQFCHMNGAMREFSVAKTLQQNGVAERKNRTLIEATRTMLAGQARQEKASDHEYILLLFMPSHSPLSSSIQCSDNKDVDEAPGKGDEGVSKGSRVDNQEKFDSSTQDVNTPKPSINAASTNINTGSLNINTVGFNDSSMPSLEETGIFDDVYDDREVGAEADTNN